VVVIGLLPVSAVPLSALAEVAAVNVYRPGSDIAVAGWTAVPAGPLFAALDEVAPTDTDYVRSPVLGTGAPAVLSLGNTLPAGAWRLRLRARRTETSGQARLVLLNAANVAQGASPWQPLAPTFTTHELLVTTTGPADRFQLEVQA
jgi:hypothetical protein